MSKYHDIASLAQEVSAQIVRNETEWTRYLTTAARLYKYPFKEQMLILNIPVRRSRLSGHKGTA